jgi:hypothetical protein
MQGLEIDSGLVVRSLMFETLVLLNRGLLPEDRRSPWKASPAFAASFGEPQPPSPRFEHARTDLHSARDLHSPEPKHCTKSNRTEWKRSLALK